MNERLHAFVSGRVQGVFYRDSTRLKAVDLDLTGWVRNLPDGRVELVAEGPRARLESLLEWCREGPPLARVTDLDFYWRPSAGDLPAFRVTF